MAGPLAPDRATSALTPGSGTAPSAWSTALRWAAQPLIWLVRLYQLTAPFRTPRCRFAPSCSQYAVESLRVHGIVLGSWYAARRLLRCHPWNPGGVDHVKPRSSARG